MALVTQKIKGGVRDTRVDIQREDELGMVAEGFNEMLISLEKNEILIREKGDRVSAIMDNVIDAIITIDATGTIESFNQSAEKIFGYSKNEITGKNISTLIPNQHANYLSNYTNINKKNVIGIGARELEGLRKDGSTLPIDIAISKASIGEKSVFIGVIRDISERKLAREALQKANEELEERVKTRTEELSKKNNELDKALATATEATRSKSEFLANMSHEIRTPMNGVLGMLGILKDSEMPNEQKEFVETAFNSGETLLSLLNDILDFSKIEAGKLDVEYIPFDIRRATEDIGGLLAERAYSQGVELIIDLPSTMPKVIMGDSTRFRQIVMNLTGNAIKFTTQGEVIIRASILEEVGKKIVLRFDIKDTGIGIPESAQNNIFESFSQADGSTTRKFGGTGLGLTICRKLVSIMGGEIGVFSKPGEGSTFWFTLPTEKATCKLPPSNNTQISILNKYCLVVDDNATNRTILEHQLKEWGVSYCSVENGKLATIEVDDAINRGTPYDFILMDMMMPVMDGIKASRFIQLKYGDKRPRIIMLTSMRGSTNEALQDENIIDAFIHKPVCQESLLNSISSALGENATNNATDIIDIKPTTPVSTTERIIGQRNFSILVTEDNKVNQRLAEVILKNLGYHNVTFADNGKLALKEIESNDYDIVLMDCQMPEMDGYQASKAIRKLDGDKSKIAIIAMTANAMRGDREKCIESGMNDYLSKPINKNEFQKMLEKWLKNG